MLSDRDIEQAHPQAFDFAFGNLPPAGQADFDRHLSGCRYCQNIVQEFSEIGRVIKDLPPHVEPPADLEERTVAAMISAVGEPGAKPGRRADTQDRTATQIYPIPERQQSEQAATRLWSRPQFQRPAEPKPQIPPAAEPSPQPTARLLPVWRRSPGRFAAAVAIAAAIIAAVIVVPLSITGGRQQRAVAFKLVSPTHQTAWASAIAHPDTSGSWNISLTVHHLKNFGDAQWYECWYLSRKTGEVASAGTFLVPAIGSGTFPMTAAVDPHDFTIMEITLGPPSKTGALHGKVVLRGTAKLL